MLLVLTTGCTAGEEPGMGSTEPSAPGSGQAADLRQATWDGDLGAARRLVEQGADVNAKDDTQQSAYLIAASEGRDRILDLTLRNGARLDDKDSFNGTALIRAAERGHAWITGRLLQAGIDRDHVNSLGWQAVHEAVWLGEPTQEYVDTVRVLVAGGVQLDRPAVEQGLTPLEMARSKGHDGQVATLERARAEAPADPDALLLRAAAEGDPDSVALALRHGADLETRDERRRTPLLLAVTEDRVAVARLLVAMGADPDALDDRSDTPWLVTGVTGSVPMLEALLPADPDLTITNRYGGISVIPAHLAAADPRADAGRQGGGARGLGDVPARGPGHRVRDGGEVRRRRGLRVPGDLLLRDGAEPGGHADPGLDPAAAGDLVRPGRAQPGDRDPGGAGRLLTRPAGIARRSPQAQYGDPGASR